MPDPNPRQQLVAELVAERHRPVPPPNGWHTLPGGGCTCKQCRDDVGRARLRELLDDEGPDRC
jgi:hypothetical protein